MNWNKIEDVVLSNVRAIHLSGTCKRSIIFIILIDDRKCVG